MRIALAFPLALSLLSLPATLPEAPVPAAPRNAPVQPALAPETRREPAMRLEKVQLPERVPEQAAAEDPFTRGSFWWYVGVIVVAGVILAVLL